MSWLARLKHSEGSKVPAPPGGFVGFVAYPPGTSQEIERAETESKGGFVGFVAYAQGGIQKITVRQVGDWCSKPRLVY